MISRGIQEGLRYLFRLWGIRELWDKILQVSGCAGLLLIRSGSVKAGISEWLFYTAAVSFLLIGGYTINAAADFAQDSLSGKSSIEPAPRRSHSLASGIAGVAIGMLLMLKATHEVLPLAVAVGTIFLGVEYSLPPIRFKERGIWGVVIGALTQRPMMFLVWAAALDVWNGYALTLACWLFSGGIAGMLGHQALDRDYDSTGGVRSFVLQKGLRVTSRLAAASGIVMALATLAPFAFMPMGQALLHAGVLAAMLSIRAGKGIRLLRQTRT